MGITPKFTKADVESRMDTYIERIERALIETLMYVGEKFVTDARNNGTYQDQTGNLRSSIGYMIVSHGVIVQSFFPGKSADGVLEGEKYAEKIALSFGEDSIVFIGVAGMDYAAYVEAGGERLSRMGTFGKGYTVTPHEVITGSSNQARSLLTRLLKNIKM